MTVAFSRRRLLTLVCVTTVGDLLAACGKKGQPLPPPGETSLYPRKYPSPSVYPHPELGGTQTKQNTPPEQGQGTPDSNSDSGTLPQ